MDVGGVDNICEGGELLAHEDVHKPWMGELFGLTQVNKRGKVVQKLFEGGGFQGVWGDMGCLIHWFECMYLKITSFVG